MGPRCLHQNQIRTRSNPNIPLYLPYYAVLRICGSCDMNINGRKTLACLCYIEAGDVMKIYPPPHMYVAKDLVPDMGNCEFWFDTLIWVLWMYLELTSYALYCSCQSTSSTSIEPWLQTKEGKSEGQAEFLQMREDRGRSDIRLLLHISTNSIIQIGHPITSKHTNTLATEHFICAPNIIDWTFYWLNLLFEKQ